MKRRQFASVMVPIILLIAIIGVRSINALDDDLGDRQQPGANVDEQRKRPTNDENQLPVDTKKVEYAEKIINEKQVVFLNNDGENGGSGRSSNVDDRSGQIYSNCIETFFFLSL
jgi:hypothetical protein